jgi:hypothetical protein
MGSTLVVQESPKKDKKKRRLLAAANADTADKPGMTVPAHHVQTSSVQPALLAAPTNSDEGLIEGGTRSNKKKRKRVEAPDATNSAEPSKAISAAVDIASDLLGHERPKKEQKKGRPKSSSDSTKFELPDFPLSSIVLDTSTELEVADGPKKKKKRKREASIEPAATEVAAPAPSPARDLENAPKKRKKRKRDPVPEPTAAEAEAIAKLSIAPAATSEKATPPKKRRKKSKTSPDPVEAVIESQPSKAPLPTPVVKAAERASATQAAKSKKPLKLQKPVPAPVKRKLQRPEGDDFLDSLLAIAATPRDPSASKGAPVDIGDFFKFELQPPRVKKKPVNTAHKIKDPVVLPAVDLADPNSVATARRKLLLDSNMRHSHMAERASTLGITLQSGRFSTTEDQIMRDSIQRISTARGITAEDFVQIVMTRPTGPSGSDESSQIFDEWRNIVVEAIDRPVDAVTKHLRVIHEPNRRLGRLSDDEDKRLRQLVAEHGTSSWPLIKSIMNRSGNILQNHWHGHVLFAGHAKGKWTSAEITKLWEAYDANLSARSSHFWSEVAKHVGTRTPNQCERQAYVFIAHGRR